MNPARPLMRYNGKPSFAERTKSPMKSMKYPFVDGGRPLASASMLSLSNGSNSTWPHKASMPLGKPARCGILMIRGVSPILREYCRMSSSASLAPKKAGSK
jgi:hypothetical protein